MEGLSEREQEALDTWQRVRDGRCACCGIVTEDWEPIAEGVLMCREWCIDPEETGRDHRDPVTVEYILSLAAEGARLARSAV